MTVNATMSATATVTLAPRGFSGRAKVRNRRRRIDGYQVVMVILWSLVLVGPEGMMKADLSLGTTTMLDAYYGAVAATAVAVTIDYYQKRSSG